MCSNFTCTFGRALAKRRSRHASSSPERTCYRQQQKLYLWRVHLLGHTPCMRLSSTCMRSSCTSTCCRKGAFVQFGSRIYGVNQFACIHGCNIVAPLTAMLLRLPTLVEIHQPSVPLCKWAKYHRAPALQAAVAVPPREWSFHSWHVFCVEHRCFCHIPSLRARFYWHAHACNMAVLASNKCQSHTAATVKPVGLYVHTFAVYFARLRTKVVTVYGISVEIAHALSQGTLVSMWSSPLRKLCAGFSNL